MIALSAGFQTTVQDCGRLGFRKFGVAVAGALDPVSLRLMNLVVGNDECAAGLEIVSGRVRLQFEEERLIAWCGGEFEVHAGATAIPPLGVWTSTVASDWLRNSKVTNRQRLICRHSRQNCKPSWRTWVFDSSPLNLNGDHPTGAALILPISPGCQPRRADDNTINLSGAVRFEV